MKKKLTYFTPTYNRADKLPKLYESLVNQTNKNFIWLVVDDGSTDNTKEIVGQWIKENKIEIEYVLKENGGKHTAIDLSNQICKTEFINCIDSDDFVSNDSTEILYNYLERVSNDESLCGIVGRCATYEGKAFNENFPKSAEALYFYKLGKKYRYTQDTNLIFKTDVIKKFKFPIFSDERFVTESVFYNQFMLDYKMLAIPELLYMAEYQEDGYTAQGMKLFYKNPKGYLYSLKQEASLSKKKNYTLREMLYYSTAYHSWKRELKLKDINCKYKIPFLYNILGYICSRTIKRNMFEKMK